MFFIIEGKLERVSEKLLGKTQSRISWNILSVIFFENLFSLSVYLNFTIGKPNMDKIHNKRLNQKFI
jgi:hypothetical protein